MIEYAYSYLVWCLIFAVVWTFLYWVRRDTRREMLLMSFLVMPMGPISEYFHVQDYWLPQTITGTLIGPEDFLIAFLIGGISGALYEWTYGVRVSRVRRGTWRYLVGAYAVGIGISVFAHFVLHLHSFQLVLILLPAFGLVAVFARPRLFYNAVYSSILFGTLLFLFYQLYLTLYPGIIDAWWFGANGVRVIGVPVEEVVWGFLWGFVAGPMSELVARLKLPHVLDRTLVKLGVPR